MRVESIRRGNRRSRVGLAAVAMLALAGLAPSVHARSSGQADDHVASAPLAKIASRHVSAPVTTTAAAQASSAVQAQTPAAGQAAGEADPGVRPVRLIDRDEIRVSRVELQPGAIRRVHAHDDVEYHVWAPVTGALEITIARGTPQAAAPGQAFFMKRGTPHGFRNTGQTPAAVFEIFVKHSTTTAALDGPAPELAAWLTALGIRPTDLVKR